MITGNGPLSLRKRDLENQKVPAVGFTKLYAAHKATAGATGINLSALTTPPEMSANGFANPTASQLTGANLLFFQNNITITSSARAPLQKNLSYVVASSTQINFIGFTALEGEIFSLTIDYSAQTGIKVVDATATPATGILTAGQTDFNIGQSFQVNKYGTTQVGACLVYVDGAIQYRNTGNSSVTKDGNFFEVDNGSGSFSVIRFNNADPDNSKNILVTPNGLLSERPDGSMMAVIEALQGQLNSAAAYLAALAGLSQTTILGSAPSNVDLKAFGDRVLALEQNTGSAASSTNSGYITVANQILAGRKSAGNSKSRTHLAGNQSVPANTETRVLFDTKDFDTNSEMDIATNKGRFTPTNAGKYLVFGKITVDALTNTGSSLNVYKNASRSATSNFAQGTNPSAFVSDMFDMNGTTDFIELKFANGDVTNARTVDGNGNDPGACFVLIVQLL